MENRFETFTSLIMSINRYVQKIKDNEMKEFGLKGNQVLCLYYLNNANDGLQFGQLCSLCNEDKAAVSRTIKDLQKKELIALVNNEDKKYKNAIKLTAAGKKISAKIALKVNAFLDIGGAGINDDERTLLYSVLNKIANNLKSSCEKGENND